MPAGFGPLVSFRFLRYFFLIVCSTSFQHGRWLLNPYLFSFVILRLPTFPRWNAWRPPTFRFFLIYRDHLFCNSFVLCTKTACLWNNHNYNKCILLIGSLDTEIFYSLLCMDLLLHFLKLIFTILRSIKVFSCFRLDISLYA